MAIATWIVPAGVYDRDNEGEVGVQALMPSTRTILAVFGLAFAVMVYGVIPWAVATGPVHP